MRGRYGFSPSDGRTASRYVARLRTPKPRINAPETSGLRGKMGEELTYKEVLLSISTHTHITTQQHPHAGR